MLKTADGHVIRSGQLLWVVSEGSIRLRRVGVVEKNKFLYPPNSGHLYIGARHSITFVSYEKAFEENQKWWWQNV